MTNTSQTKDPAGDEIKTTEFVVATEENAEADQACAEEASLADRSRELVAATLRQLEAIEGDDGGKARLHCVLGLIFEHRLGDVRRALSHYMEARRLSPSNRAAIRSARRIFRARHNWAMVLELLDDERSLTATPARAAQLLLQAGRIYEFWLANTDRAIEAYTAALKVDPGNRQVLESLKHLVERRKDGQALIGICQKAAASSQDRGDRSLSLAQMGRVYEQLLGNEQAAIESYAAAFTEDPTNVSVASALKRLYHRHGRWRDLVDVLLVEGQLSSGRPQVAAHLEAARICRQVLDHPDRALEVLSQALELAPDDRALLEKMAELLHDAGRYEELADVQRRRIAGLVDDGERVAVLVQLGQILEDRLGQTQQALEAYRQALAIDPTHVPALKSIGRLCQRLGEWDELVAISATEADLLTDSRQRAAYLCGLAELCETQLGDTERAIELHRRALTGLAWYAPSVMALERIHTARGDWTALSELLASQLGGLDGVDRGRLLMRLGELCEERLEDLERAGAFYERAVEEIPGDLSLMRSMQRLFARMERWDRVVLAVDLQVQNIDDDVLVVALMHKAAEICETRLSDLEAAMRRYQQVLVRDPDYFPTLQALGRIYFRLGRFNDLVALYGMEVEQASTQPRRKISLLYKMGEIYLEQLDDTLAAERTFLQALEINPRFLPAIQVLVRLYRQMGAWEKLIGALRRQVDVLSDPERKAATLHDIGELFENEIKDEERAIECYREAVQHSPTHPLARAALLRLLTVKERFREVVEVCREAMSSTQDREAQIALLKHAGGIWDQQLLDPDQAAACYEQALALGTRGDMETLSALASLYRRTANFPKLVQIQEKQAICATDTAQSVGHLYEAASIMEVHLPRQSSAHLYERIVQAASGELLALEVLDGMYDRTHLAKRIEVCEAQRRLVDDPDCRLSLLLQSAGLREAAGDLESAVEMLKEALSITDDWVVLREQRRLYERLGDWEEVVQCLLQEARLSQDRELAVECLMQAAVICRQRLDDRAREADALGLLLRRDPFHEEAAARLEQLLVQRKAWQELVENLRGRLEVIAAGVWPGDRNVTQVQIELLARMAWIQRQHLDQPLEAVATLTRSLQLDPNHLATLLSIGDLYTEQELWKEAIDIGCRIVALESDPDVLRGTHFRLAELWSEKLGDIPQAISSYQNVLALSETDCDALSRLSQMFVKIGDWDNAEDTIHRLIEVEQEPAQLVMHYATLAEIQLKRFGDPRMAASQLQQALAIDPTNETILSDLSRLYSQVEEWEALTGALRSFVAALPRDQDSRGIAHRLHLGEILRHRLARPMDALEQYRAVVEIDPTNIEARMATSDILIAEGRLDEAMNEHRDIQSIDSLNAASLQRIRDIWSSMGNQQMAHVVAGVLVALEQARPSDEALLEGQRQRPAWSPRVSLEASLFESIIVHPDEHPPGRETLAILGEVAYRIRPPRLTSWQVGKADRLPLRSEDPLRSLVREVSLVIDLERDVDIYISRARSKEMDLLLTDPPALVAGSEMMRAHAPQDIRFWLGCLLSYLRNRTWLAYRLSGTELSRLIHAACLAAEAREPFSEAEQIELGDLVQLIQRSMGRRTRRVLQEACGDLLATSEPDYAKWAQAIQHTAVHTGLWVVNDLETALRHLGRLDPQLGPTDRRDRSMPLFDQIRRSPLATELVEYWMSEEFNSLKRASGG